MKFYKFFLGLLLFFLLLATFGVSTVFADEPVGQGLWIWRVWEEDFFYNPDTLISQLKKAGISWVAIKAGDGDSLWSDPDDIHGERNAVKWISDNISKFHSAGIKVYGWQYAYGDDDKWGIINVSEADVANQILDILGIDGFIVDAESEYKIVPENQTQAENYLKAIYKKHSDAFVIYTTFARPGNHSGFPFSVFNQYTKAVLPQVYWIDRGYHISPSEELAIMKTQWEKISPKVPIYPLASLSDVTQEEMEEFFTTIKSYNFQNPSFWRYGTISQEAWSYLYQASVYTVFQDLLGRDPDWGGLSFYTKFLNDGGTIEEVRLSIQGSPEYQARKAFLDLLNREPDIEGLQFYINMINQGWSVEKIRQSITDSDEYRLRLIGDTYLNILRRKADYEGLQFYLQMMKSGSNLVEIEENIKNSLEYVFWDLLERAPDSDGYEFYSQKLKEGLVMGDIRSDIKSSQEYRVEQIKKIYTELLDRGAENEGLQFYLNKIMDGWTMNDVRLSIMASDEYKLKRITNSYRDILKRDPDQEGLQFYFEKIKSGWTWEAMQEGLMASEEYKLVAR